MMGARRLALAFLGLAACYSTPTPNCAFRCGPSGDCPSGYICVPDDGICHLIVGGAAADCPATTPMPDAPLAMPDAPPEVPDAPIVMPDSPPAIPDAKPPMPDAPPPPPIDAPPPPPIDAPPPPIDAPPPVG